MFWRHALPHGRQVAKQSAERVTKDVGRKLAEFRVRAGLTQEAFAEKLGMAPNNLQRIELGMQNLTIGTLVRLANGLGIPVARLFLPPRSRAVRTGRPPRRASKPARGE